MGRMSDKQIEDAERDEKRIDDAYDEFLVDEAYAIAHPKIPEWEDRIRRVWESILKMGITPNFYNPDTYVENTFLSEIWHMSTQAFEKPREIQVVVGANDRLFISVGTPSFVDFKDAPVGLKLPIKSWIHTHPSGSAFFSGTDWRTIKAFEPVMQSAIVLGDNQYWAYNIKNRIVKQVKFGTLEFPESVAEQLKRYENTNTPRPERAMYNTPVEKTKEGMEL